LNSENSRISLGFLILIYIKKENLIMHIKRFDEKSNVGEISNERLDEISTDMAEVSDTLNNKVDLIDLLLNEISQFKSQSNKKVDQIDEIMTELQLLNKTFIESQERISKIVSNIDDYREDGRKELF